jgi:hypothetical protein
MRDLLRLLAGEPFRRKKALQQLAKVEAKATESIQSAQ